MAILKSYHNKEKVLIWEKNGGLQKKEPVNDSKYDPKKDIYIFSTCENNNKDKTLFFATDEFTHGIKFIESTKKKNSRL